MHGPSIQLYESKWKGGGGVGLKRGSGINVNIEWVGWGIMGLEWSDM